MFEGQWAARSGFVMTEFMHTHQQETAASFLESLESLTWKPVCFICPVLVDVCVMSLWSTTLWPHSEQTQNTQTSLCSRPLV